MSPRFWSNHAVAGGEAEIVYDFVQVGDLQLPPLARDRRDASHDTTARHERNDQLGEVAQTDEVASPDVGGRERLWHAGAIHKHVHRSADRRDRTLDRGRVTQIGLFETGDGQVGLVQVERVDLRPELDQRRRRRAPHARRSAGHERSLAVKTKLIHPHAQLPSMASHV